MEEAQRIIRIPIEVEACKEGGFSVRSPMFPELISEGDTFDEAWRNAYDAAIAVLELYEDMGKKIPNKAFVLQRRRLLTKAMKIHWRVNATQGVSGISKYTA